MKKKKLDELVHDVVEERIEEISDELADRVAMRLMSYRRVSEDGVSDSVQPQSRVTRLFNPYAGP